MFKTGDKVRVKDIAAVKEWMNGPQVVGKEFILTQDEADALNKNSVVMFANNKYHINFEPYYLRIIKEDWDC